MTKRYNYSSERVEEIKEVDDFVNDILKVYSKHGFCFDRDEMYGDFLIIRKIEDKEDIGRLKHTRMQIEI